MKIRGAGWENCPSKERVEGDDTLLRSSVRAPEGFSEGLPEENPEGALTLPRSTVLAPEALS